MSMRHPLAFVMRLSHHFSGAKLTHPSPLRTAVNLLKRTVDLLSMKHATDAKSVFRAAHCQTDNQTGVGVEIEQTRVYELLRFDWFVIGKERIAGSSRATRADGAPLDG